MLQAALRSGAAHRRAVFEVFARHLPHGRRYGVVAGTGRLLDAIERFRFSAGRAGLPGRARASWTRRRWRTWNRTGSAATSGATPRATVTSPARRSWWWRARSPRRCVLETLALSILNHDCAIASAASRMVTAAGDRPLIEMGSRRTHERAAVASARAAYIAGFASTSNLRARLRLRHPDRGHQRARVHPGPRQRAARVRRPSSTRSARPRRCWWTRTTWRARCGPPSSWPGRTWARCGSTAATCRWWPGRSARCWTSWARRKTRIVLTGDLDEYSIAALAAAPVDGYGVGTSLVTGSGAPTAALVYKLVARAWSARSDGRAGAGGQAVGGQAGPGRAQVGGAAPRRRRAPRLSRA